jgi:formate hydrogenlyase subunit 6/NADH:ubiquinone oxidoreductase subunit I
VLCSEVCPTGAIQESDSPTKGLGCEGTVNSLNADAHWNRQFMTREVCLPWAKATDCVVCLEWCPVSPKAIYVKDRHGDGRGRQSPDAEAAVC